MPLLQLDSTEGQSLSKTRNAFGSMAALQEQDSFRSQNAGVWSPNGLANGFLSPPALSNVFQFGQGFGSNGIPRADSVSKSSLEEVKGTALLGATPPKTDTSVSLPEAEPGKFAPVNPFSPKRSSTLGQKSPYPHSPLGAFGEANLNSSDGSDSSSEDSALSKGCDKDPSKNLLPGLGHSSPVTDKFSSPQELGAANGDLNHQRQPLRLSSTPIIPSPLGSRHKTHGVSLEKADPVSPHPATPTSRSHRQIPEEGNDIQMFGLDTRDFNGQDGRFNTKPFGFGHGRKPTDPFVEPVDKWSQPLKASPFVTQAQQKFMFPTNPEIEIPSTPVFYAQANQLSPNGEGPMRWSPDRHSANTGSQSFQPYQSNGPATPSFQGFNNPDTRLDLRIPPPPLAVAQEHLVHSPSSRARLDAQADIRGDWIRNEARKITDLSRLSFAAAQRFQQTESQEDYEVWQRLATAYDDATSLEKRQEERRNMFMPEGIQASKTGAESDQSAAYPTGGQEDGKLLGFQMAYMERVCAEVKRRTKEEEEKGSISLEMLDTLSLDEKKALREHLVARLQNGTAARRAGVLSESFI